MCTWVAVAEALLREHVRVKNERREIYINRKPTRLSGFSVYGIERDYCLVPLNPLATLTEFIVVVKARAKVPLVSEPVPLVGYVPPKIVTFCVGMVIEFAVTVPLSVSAFFLSIRTTADELLPAEIVIVSGELFEPLVKFPA